MVGTIGFAGSKAKENGLLPSWVGTIAIPHLVAAALGGALMGLLAGSVGLFVPRLGDARTVIGPIVAAGGAALEVARVPANLLARAKQVPLSWKHVFPAPMSSVLYGATLGVGVASNVYFWSFWVMLAAAVVIGSPAAGAVIGLSYGVGRTLPVFVAALAVPQDHLLLAVEAWQRFRLGVVAVSLFAMALIAAGLMIGA